MSGIRGTLGRDKVLLTGGLNPRSAASWSEALGQALHLSFLLCAGGIITPTSQLCCGDLRHIKYLAQSLALRSSSHQPPARERGEGRALRSWRGPVTVSPLTTCWRRVCQPRTVRPGVSRGTLHGATAGPSMPTGRASSAPSASAQASPAWWCPSSCPCTTTSSTPGPSGTSSTLSR